MNTIIALIRPLMTTKERRYVLLGITSGYMLIQLLSLPVALSVPTLAQHFHVEIAEASWIVIAYLLGLGSCVLLAARFGDRYGHVQVFFIGIVISTIGAFLISLSSSLMQIILWRVLTGIGAALVMGNANAILAATFPSGLRGRAFSLPIMGSRLGTLIGLILFSFFLQFFTWRLIFVAFLPLGLIATLASIPMLLQKESRNPLRSVPIDFIGGGLFVIVAAILILSGNHLHSGEESFTSSDGLKYHLPMHGLFLLMLGIFILVERKLSNPLVDVNHFRQKYFSLSIASNATFHFSMLATMVLIPILVERGFELEPVWVTVALVPNQVLGIIIPLIAGWVYDRYQPRMLRPAAMACIAFGFLAFGLLSNISPFWAIPLMMIPISVGSAVFNPINNATIMSTLPLNHRGFASGMLETTRELGHALGATASATALSMALPSGLILLSNFDARSFYIQGFQSSSMMVVLVMSIGAIMAFVHRDTSKNRTV